MSDLRRNAARFIDMVTKAHAHVFVTQRGYVTAVLLSRGEYEALWRCRRQVESEVAARATTPGSPRPLEERDWLTVTLAHAGRAADDLAARPIWTEYGWCDYESARALAEQGIDTELIETDEGWLPDDEG